MGKYLLEFLLIVETINHKIISQDVFDRSTTGGPTFYYDIKDLHLLSAILVGKGHVFKLDLVDGHLEADGSIFYPPKTPSGKLDFIYYRQVTRTVGIEEPTVKYFIGWKVHSKSQEWIIGVN